MICNWVFQYMFGLIFPYIFCIFQFLVCHLFSILEDIILLGLNEPRGHDRYEHDGIAGKVFNAETLKLLANNNFFLLIFCQKEKDDMPRLLHARGLANVSPGPHRQDRKYNPFLVKIGYSSLIKVTRKSN